MEDKETHPFVTIYCDIVDDTDANIDSDATIDLVTTTQQSPSLTPTDHGIKIMESTQSSPSPEKVSTHIIKSIQTQSTQEITRARQLYDEKLAVVELSNNTPLVNPCVCTLRNTYRHQFHRAIKIFSTKDIKI